jgi:DNA-binding winged helix-turn-helix (wHTH) protein/tetratricopeptide (TPR) repeat protein
MLSPQWLFGDFRLDPDNARLWCGAQAIPLTPRAFDVLHYLVTHPDRLVSKDTLLYTVWPETAIGDTVVRIAISELRRALGDTVHAPRFIATVPRRGYRFLGPVIQVVPPDAASAALAPRPQAPARPHAPSLAAAPLVGRETVLDHLHVGLAQARQGQRQMLFLTGEPGIGKTAVVAAFCAEVALDPAAWLAVGQCVEHYGTGEAYLPVLEVLGQLCRGPGREPMVALLQQYAPTWLVQMPWLLTTALREQLRDELQGTTRERMLREFADMVDTLTAETPLVLVLEDLHWSDYATLDLLALLARRQTPAHLLVLGTYRPVEAIVRHHPLRTVVQDLQRHGVATEVPLGLLSAAAVSAYLAARFPQQQLPTTLAPWLHQRTDGQPLFLVTLVQALVEQGVLHEQDGGWTMQGKIEAIPLEVPKSLRQLLEQHITRLPSEAQRVLEVASVAGVEFGAAVVAAGLEADATTVEEVCEALAERQLLHPVGVTTWPNGTVTARYAFVHALYQQVVYERLGAGRRVRLHQCLGGCLEAAYSAQAGEIATALAEHFVRGQDTRRAVHYLRQAGDNALTRSAYHEAVACYEHALAALAQLPESRDTCALAIDLRLALRNVLWTLGELGRLFVTLQEAAGLAEALGDDHRLGWVLVYLLAHFAQVGDPECALAAGQRALALATPLGERGLTVVAQHYLGGVYRSLGDYRRAIECFRMNVACLDGQLLQKHLGLPGLAAVFARSHLVIALAECGAFAEGRAPAEEGVRMAEAAKHPYSRVMAWWAVGILTLRQGDLPQAIVVLERALALVQGADLRLLVPMVAAPLGVAYALTGRTADAVPLLEQAVTQAVARQYLWDQALRVVWLGEAYLCAGRLAEAGLQAQQALEFAQAHLERGHEAYALRLLGEIAAHRTPPDVDAAAAHYRQALAVADELGMRPLQAHCHLGLGTLYSQTGQLQRAQTALSAAIDLYRVMDMTFWLPQAEAALAQVEGPTLAKGDFLAK